MFQPEYNRITADRISFSRTCSYRSSPEGRRVWSLARNLNTAAPDRDSRRLGNLARLSMEADRLHDEAARRNDCSKTPSTKSSRKRSTGWRSRMWPQVRRPMMI